MNQALRIIRNTVLVLFLFCAVFTPDLFSFSMRYLIVLVSFVGVVVETVFRKGRLNLKDNYISIFKGFIPFIVYLLLVQISRMIVSDYTYSIYSDLLTHTLLAVFSAFLISYFLVQLCERCEINFNHFACIIIVVTLIQFICVVLALIFPSVRNFFINLIIKHSYSDRLIVLAKASLSGWADRSYGLSNNMFDSFGYITCLLIILVYAYGMELKNYKIVILSFLMVIIPLVNSRTGVLLVLIGFFIVSLFYNDIRTVIKNTLIVIVAVLALLVLLNHLPESMVVWLNKGVNETASLFGGGEVTGTFSELFEKDIVFPNDIIFGAGYSPVTEGYSGIDNGYICCIWHFGLIGTFLLFLGVAFMYIKVFFRYDNRFVKSIIISYLIVYFVYLFKIYSIDNFGGNTLVFSVPILMLSLPFEDSLKHIDLN